jgi:predicted Zn-dependent protease
MIGKRHRNWFTLFFIPIFPISRVSAFTECANCHACFGLDLDQFQKNSADVDQRALKTAIGLFNTLRQSPGDSALLNQLLEMYGGMREYGEAVSAARSFPEALNASATCMTTLGKIHLANNDPVSAIGCLEAALARNSLLGEALFFSALAHLNMKPPNAERAMGFARQAQAAGHPDAQMAITQAATALRGKVEG